VLPLKNCLNYRNSPFEVGPHRLRCNERNGLGRLHADVPCRRQPIEQKLRRRVMPAAPSVRRVCVPVINQTLTDDGNNADELCTVHTFYYPTA
jgi:hypothetical protein